ncbi:hypothetical protein LBMAG56_41700 [Verrucomicrobiota bacterium]|nr:hypothetical protein LBMAG56_41700 [Verrucomicrobiota bacterium]
MWRLRTGAAGAKPELLNPSFDALAPYPGFHSGPITVSADGAWYIFASTRFDPTQVGYLALALCRSDFSAAESVQYTDTNGVLTVIHHEGMPVVSAGGSNIVFGGRGPHLLDLYRMHRLAVGWSVPLLLTADSPNNYNYWPSLSPDGTRVVFNSGNDPYVSTNLAEVRLDGSGFRILITKDGGPPGMEVGPSVHSPSYGPDGSLVFEAEWGGGETVWRLPAGGGPPVKVRADFNNDNSPVVLPDGRIVSLLEGGFHQVKVMDLDGQNARVLTPQDAPGFSDVADIGVGCGALWVPSLDLQADAGELEVVWPVRFGSYTLQGVVSLPGGRAWSNLATGTNSFRLPGTSPFRFFRLVR